MRKFIELLYKYGLFLLCLLTIIAYVIYSSQILQGKSIETVIINITFALLNIFATIYIASRVSLWGWNSDNVKNQKKLAKTAVRHIRGYLTQIIKIQRIISKKLEEDRDKDKRDLKEINNHLEILFTGIKSSEADFKEIVNEELKEQDVVEKEIGKILEELEDKNNELENLKQDKDSSNKKVKELEKSVSKLESDLHRSKNKLLFDNPYLSGGTGSGLLYKRGDTSTGIRDYLNDDFLSKE